MYSCNDGFCGAYDCPRCYCQTTCETCERADYDCECVPCSERDCETILREDADTPICPGCQREAAIEASIDAMIYVKVSASTLVTVDTLKRERAVARLTVTPEDIYRAVELTGLLSVDLYLLTPGLDKAHLDILTPLRGLTLGIVRTISQGPGWFIIDDVIESSLLR